MRIDAKLAGNSTCFHLDCETMKGVGFDSPATVTFATALCDSINRHMSVLQDMFGDQLKEDAKKVQKHNAVVRSIKHDRFAHIYIDVYMERQKGKPVVACKISTDDGDGDIRTMNILSEVAHYVYKIVWFLRSKKPPKGMDCLRTMTIIRNFHDPYKDTHECYVDENGDLQERLKAERPKK